MEKNDVVSMEIGKDVVKPIVESKIKIAIAEALGGGEKITESVVETILKQRVDCEGKHHGDRYYDKFSFIDLVTNKMLQEAVKQAIKEWVETQKPQITAIMLKKMKQKGTSEKFVSAFLNGVTEGIKSSYAFDVKVEYKTPRDY